MGRERGILGREGENLQAGGGGEGEIGGDGAAVEILQRHCGSSEGYLSLTSSCEGVELRYNFPLSLLHLLKLCSRFPSLFLFEILLGFDFLSSL